MLYSKCDLTNIIIWDTKKIIKNTKYSHRLAIDLTDELYEQLSHIFNSLILHIMSSVLSCKLL